MKYMHTTKKKKNENKTIYKMDKIKVEIKENKIYILI